MLERKKKILSLLIGSAIGDALGVPYEFRARGTFCCTTMIGNGTHLQPVGTWSDDTSMSLCLAEQIAEGFDLNKLADKFLNWCKSGYMTAHGDTFDIGSATLRAITKYEEVRDVSSLTHAHEISVSACYIYIQFLNYLLQGLPKSVAYNEVLAYLDSDFWKVVFPHN